MSEGMLPESEIIPSLRPTETVQAPSTPEPTVSTPGTPEAHADTSDAPRVEAAPDVADVSSEGDVTQPREASTEVSRPIVEQAADAVDVVFRNKHREVVGNMRDERRAPQDHEAALIMVGAYAEGFVNHNFDEESLPVDRLPITVEGDKKVTVNALTNQTKNPDGSVTYTYEGKTTDGSDETVTGEVKGEAMATAQLHERKDEILKNFTDENEKKLVEWQADGADAEDIPLTTDEINALMPQEGERKNEALSLIDDALALRGAELSARIAALGQVEGSTQEIAKAKQVLELLAAVKEQKGGAFEVTTREFAMKQIVALAAEDTKNAQARGETLPGSTAVKRLERLTAEQLPVAKAQAREELKHALETTNPPLTQELREQALSLFDSPAEMMKYLNPDSQSADIKALQENPDIAKALMGDTSEQAKQMLDDFMAKAEVVLTDEQRQKYDMAKKLFKGGTITAGGLGLLLLALTGLAMSLVAKGMSSDSRAA